MTNEEAKITLIQYSDDCADMPDYEVMVEACKVAIKSLEQTRWIPVTERLPESCGMYIVTREIHDPIDMPPIIMSDESWFDGQNTWHNDNRINHKRGYLTDVIAWMPLPEPYKKESENKQ